MYDDLAGCIRHWLPWPLNFIHSFLRLKKMTTRVLHSKRKARSRNEAKQHGWLVQTHFVRGKAKTCTVTSSWWQKLSPNALKVSIQPLSLCTHVSVRPKESRYLFTYILRSGICWYFQKRPVNISFVLGVLRSKKKRNVLNLV